MVEMYSQFEGTTPHVMLLVDKYNLGTEWKVLELEGDVERSHI